MSRYKECRCFYMKLNDKKLFDDTIKGEILKCFLRFSNKKL